MKSRGVMRNFWILCSVCFVAAGGNAMAQDQTPIDTNPVDTIPEETTPVELEEPEVPDGLVVVEEAIDDISVEPPEGEINESTGRFIPTEQISQDLGVSFPANI